MNNYTKPGANTPCLYRKQGEKNQNRNKLILTEF